MQVYMYLGIEFQIEVPEKMNELRNNSVLELEDDVSNFELISDVKKNHI